MLKRVLIAVIALLVGTVPAVYAQEPPQAVLDALAALSAQAGTTLELSDLSSWTWAQQNFPDTSLGCPRQGYSYPQIATNGFIVNFVYNGVLYDYRVSADRQVIFQCTAAGGAPGGTPGPGAGATPTATAAAPATAIATPSAPIVSSGLVICPGNLPTRLAVGMRAKSITTGSINIRSATTLTDPASVIGLLLPGGDFDVIGGPQCADNRTWWRISYNSATANTTGWIIEGVETEYWVEPIGGAPTGTTGTESDRAPITAANAAQVKILKQTSLPQNLIWAAFMPAPRPDAFLSMSQIPAYYLGSTVQPLTVTIGHPDHTVNNLATAAKDAQTGRLATLETNISNPTSGMLLYIADIAPGATAPVITERFGFQLPFIANDLAFSADGRWLAVTSGSVMGAEDSPAGVWVWDAGMGAQVTTIQLNSAAQGVAFSPDGKLMAISAPLEGTYLWDTATWTQVVLLPGDPCLAGSSCLVFSPDSRLLAVGTQANGLQLWDVASQTLTRTFTPPLAGAVAYVDFTPDGSVLAIGVVHFLDATRTTSIYLWDAAAGTQLAFLETYNDSLMGLAFRSEGRELITIGMQSWWSWGVE